jgi:hypothetical protein
VNVECDTDENFKDDQEFFTVFPASTLCFELRAKFLHQNVFFHRGSTFRYSTLTLIRDFDYQTVKRSEETGCKEKRKMPTLKQPVSTPAVIKTIRE